MVNCAALGPWFLPEALIQLTALGGIGLITRAVMRHSNLVLGDTLPSLDTIWKLASDVPQNACMSISSQGQEWPAE